MTPQPLDVDRIIATWTAFKEAAHVHPIRSDTDYNRTVRLMEELVDRVGDDERHPLASLLAIVGELVADYDRDHFVIPASEPREALRFLMEQHGLRQSDLSDIVAQPNLSAILNGHREISREVAKRLAERFGVGVDIFV